MILKTQFECSITTALYFCTHPKQDAKIWDVNIMTALCATMINLNKNLRIAAHYISDH